jgi:colanic acid biosynthesis glycosyl transferase WcaI
LRILVVTQYFWPESFRVNDLVVALRDRGHDVTVLTALPNYPGGKVFDGYSLRRGPWREEFEGVPVLRVPLLPRGSGSGVRLGLNFASFALAACILGPARISGRPDVIFAYEPSPITVALPAIAFRRLRRAPNVLWVQDLWPHVLEAAGAVTSRRVLALASSLTSWIYRHCDLILAQSRAFLPLIESSGVGDAKLDYLPNWAEDLYRPMAVEAGAPEDREMPAGFRIVFAGNLGESQALSTILAAAEKLRDTEIRWIFLGDGRRRNWMEKEIARRGLEDSVFLLGRKPTDVMPRYFALADALLASLKANPIYAWTIPSKLQSYMACAKPVLAALEGEGAAIVHESRGGLVARPEDPDSLAQAALTLLGMPEPQRRALGQSSLAYFKQHFERELVVGKLEQTLHDLAAAKI